MGSLVYVGKTPTQGRDISTRADSEGLLTAGVSRSYVTGRVAELATGKATKVYVDTQDSTFADAAYPAAQDALLVPLTSKGVANGVATLDSGGKIPSAQVPVLGAGILRGPFGHTQAYTGSTTVTPMKIADFPGGVLGVNCQLMIFMTVLVICDNLSHPVIEVRYSTAGGTTYASQTLVAAGVGRAYFGDSHTVSVMPVTALVNEGQDGIQDTISSTASLTINAWLYDAANEGGQVATQTGYNVSSAMYLARVAL